MQIYIHTCIYFNTIFSDTLIKFWSFTPWCSVHINRVYFRSVRKIVWTVWYHLYVCELQRGYSMSILLGQQYACPYPNPAPWPPKLILQHNLDAVTFDTTRYTEHTAQPSNSTQQSHLFCRSCHGPRICRHHVSAWKSIVSSCLCLSRLILGQYDTTRNTERQYDTTFSPVKSRPENLSSSRFGPKIHCVFLSLSFPIDFGTTGRVRTSIWWVLVTHILLF